MIIPDLLVEEVTATVVLNKVLKYTDSYGEMLIPVASGRVPSSKRCRLKSPEYALTNLFIGPI